MHAQAPAPSVGTCGQYPAAGEVYLFSNASYSGGYCWRLSIPSGTYSESYNVWVQLGIPNDVISSAIVGPGTEVDMFDDHFYGGAAWPLWDNGTLTDRPYDENFGLSPDIQNFNDKLTSLKLYRI